MDVRHTDEGFTLIELMIVVAIVAISAAIAYPSYQESVARGRRAEAKAVLLECAYWIERQYTMSGAYNKKDDGTALTSAALPYIEAPKDGTAKYYDIAFVSLPTATEFALRATPKNAMVNDKCGVFTLNQAGARSLKGNAPGTDVASCWDR